MGIALAAILGLGSASSTSAPIYSGPGTVKTQGDFKAPSTRVNTRHKVVKEVGGLNLMDMGGNFGMTPKEYGQIYGNGGSKRSNRLRYGHNAKLKRRGVC